MFLILDWKHMRVFYFWGCYVRKHMRVSGSMPFTGSANFCFCRCHVVAGKNIPLSTEKLSWQTWIDISHKKQKPKFCNFCNFILFLLQLAWPNLRYISTSHVINSTLFMEVDLCYNLLYVTPCCKSFYRFYNWSCIWGPSQCMIEQLKIRQTKAALTARGIPPWRPPWRSHSCPVAHPCP